MSDLFARLNGQADVWKEAQAACGFLVEKYPLLHRVLMGEPSGGGQAGRLPGSVRIFTNGGELKACIQGKEWLFDGYLVLPKEVSIIENIETELEAGRIGWSASGVQKNSSKKAPY